jgi:CubicO group peptidase (beta-lactamase class C family)
MADRCDDAASIRAPGKADALHGYGYQVWLRPGPARRFTLIGVRGQMIFVDPATRLVMVHTAVRPKFVGPAPRETVALWTAVVNQFGGNGR